MHGTWVIGAFSSFGRFHITLFFIFLGVLLSGCNVTQPGAFRTKSTTERFSPLTDFETNLLGQSLDVVFVIDSSGSMNRSRQLTLAAAQDFADYMNTQVDANGDPIGDVCFVTLATDFYFYYGFTGTVPQVSRVCQRGQTPAQFRANLIASLDVGIAGSGREQAFSSLIHYLSLQVQGLQSALRANVPRMIFVVTDENTQESQISNAGLTGFATYTSPWTGGAGGNPACPETAHGHLYHVSRCVDTSVTAVPAASEVIDVLHHQLSRIDGKITGVSSVAPPLTEKSFGLTFVTHLLDPDNLPYSDLVWIRTACNYIPPTNAAEETNLINAWGNPSQHSCSGYGHYRYADEMKAILPDTTQIPIGSPDYSAVFEQIKNTALRAAVGVELRFPADQAEEISVRLSGPHQTWNLSQGTDFHINGRFVSFSESARTRMETQGPWNENQPMAVSYTPLNLAE